MSARLKPSPVNDERPALVQTVLAGGIYTYLLKDCLSLNEADARAVEREFNLPPETQNVLGYRSAPETLKIYPSVKNEDVSRWLDSLPDDEFSNWFTHSKQPLFTFVRPDVPTDEYNLHLNIIEHAIIERFGTVAGIPGLYIDDRLRAKLPRRGLIVPCRIEMIPRALLVYPRIGEDRTFWLSTNGLNGGAPARASLHIANEFRAVRDRLCILVSHTMEADALACESHECVVAVNGLSPLRVMRELKLVLPDLKGCAVSPLLGDKVARTLRENGLRVRLIETGGQGCDEN